MLESLDSHMLFLSLLMSKLLLKTLLKNSVLRSSKTLFPKWDAVEEKTLSLRIKPAVPTANFQVSAHIFVKMFWCRLVLKKTKRKMSQITGIFFPHRTSITRSDRPRCQVWTDTGWSAQDLLDKKRRTSCPFKWIRNLLVSLFLLSSF